MTYDAFQGTDRFVIQRKLGRGMTGSVFEVFDRERNTNVALKALSRLEPSTLYRFKREFRALADVNHPNLVQLYDLSSDHGHWFFTMELVEGDDFLDYLRPNKSDSGSPVDRRSIRLDLYRLHHALEQLTHGLMALHATGKVHCDLKPSNVLVTQNDRLVLLDLGLVRDLSSARLFESIDDSISGTPAYMSPEQGAGVRVDQASDWYALGVMLYEALTGTVPFQGSVVHTIIQKQHNDPVHPGELDSAVPAHLARLCMALLNRDPMKRPTGNQILDCLGASASQSHISLSDSSQSTSETGSYMVRAPLHQELLSALEEVKQGQMASVMLHGPSGMGKTVSVRMFLSHVRHEVEDALVLEGRCFQRESVPYKALDQLVDTFSRFLKSLADEDAMELVPEDIHVLARLFPVLRRVNAVARMPGSATVQIPDSFEQRRRAFAVLRECFARIAQKRLLVLFIDDLQWGDLDSALLLNDVLRGPEAPPLLFLGCYRDEEAEASAFLDTLQWSEMETRRNWQELVVGELSAGESLDLAQRLLGDSTDDPAVAERIANESGGCPFFIESLVRFTKTSGLDPDAVEIDAHSAPASMNRVIQAQLARIPDDARKLLEVIALAGQPIDLEAARQATELTDIQSALATLRVARFIRIRGERRQERVECYHDKVREAVVEQIEPQRLGPYHLMLAQTLHLSGHADPESLAFHFQEAGESDRAAEFVAEAADQAAQTLAFDRAARLYKIALDLERGQISPEMHVKLGNALVNAGRGAQAAESYLVAAKDSKSAVSLELQRRAAEQLLISGRIDQGVAVIQQVLQGIGMSLPSSPARAILSLVLRRFLLRLRGFSFNERDTSQISQEQLIRIDACWSVSVGLGIVDPIRGMDFGTRHLLLALRAGEPYRVARALAIEGGYSATGGRRKAARTQQLILASTRLSQKVDNPHASGLTHMVAGIASFLEGKWRVAAERLQRAETILRSQCTGATWEIDTSVLFNLRALLLMGRFSDVAQRLPALLKDDQARGDLYAENNLRSRITWFAWLVANEPNLAIEEINVARKQWSTQSFMIQHYWHMTGLSEVALYTGNRRQALEHFELRWPEFKKAMFLRIQFTRTEAISIRGRCALAAWSEDPNAQSPALKLVRQVIKSMDKEDLAWARPLARLLEAGVMAGLNQNSKAAELLNQAMTECEDQDMRGFEAAARHRCGELIGGIRGKQLRDSAIAWFRDENVVDVDAMLNVLAPGPWTQPQT